MVGKHQNSRREAMGRDETHSKKSLIPRKIKKRPLTGVEIPQKNVYYIEVLKFSKWPKIYYIYSNLLNKKSVSTKKFTISRFFTISIVTISRFDCSIVSHVLSTYLHRQKNQGYLWISLICFYTVFD